MSSMSEGAGISYFFMNATSSEIGMRRWPPGVTRALSLPC